MLFNTDIDADHSASVSGVFYTDFLSHLHKTRRPRTYLEVGTMAGNTLALAQCASLAIDPQYVIDKDVVGAKPMCLMFQETSDGFFATKDPKTLLGSSIDLAFLDGMHVFDFLLRDFINAERHASPDGMIVLHDCLPPGFFMTTASIDDPIRHKSRFENYWTGDVWRMVPTLQMYRPDLTLQVVDCPPTGLVLVSGLDPEDNMLSERYEEIVQAHAAIGMNRGAYDEYWRQVTVEQSRDLMTQATL